MSAGNDGGPAFPVVNMHDTSLHVHDGMSLRDYFAGKALAATKHAYGQAYEALAKESYKIADAMLAQRAQSGGAKP